MKIISIIVLCSVLILSFVLELAWGQDEGESIDLSHYLGKRWYGVYFQNSKSGYAVTDTTEEKYKGQDAHSFSMSVVAKITMLGTKIDMTLSEKRVFSKAGNILYVDMKMESGGIAGMGMSAKGEVDGDQMKLVRVIAGQRTEQTVPAPTETLADYLAASRLVERGAKVGDSVESNAFEPSLGRNVTALTTVKEKRDILWNGIETSVVVLDTFVKEMNMHSISCVDKNGEMLEMKAAGILTMRLEDEKQAKDITYSHDLVNSGVVKTEKKITDVSSVKEMTVRLGGIDGEHLILNSGRQKFQSEPDGSYLLKTKIDVVVPEATQAIPFDKEKFKEELSPTVFVQSDDPKIKQLSKSIVGDETNSFEIAKKINTWVYENLAKKATASFSNALETLKSKEGDCTEHTVLFVALARAAGVPARQLSGVTYWQRGGGFYYHAWPEVYVGKWIAVDPTFHEYIANATHIKFSVGGLESMVKTASLFGKLKAEIIDYSN